MLRVRQTIEECIAKVDFAQVAPTASVADATATMRAKKADCVLIVDNGVLVGIFTERDFVNRVAAVKRVPAETEIRAVMTANPSTLRPHDRVAYAINQMAVGSFRNVPVVDDDGAPVSVLDVRLIMTHLIKVFAEIEQSEESDAGEEWIDIGGG